MEESNWRKKNQVLIQFFLDFLQKYGLSCKVYNILQGLFITFYNISNFFLSMKTDKTFKKNFIEKLKVV